MRARKVTSLIPALVAAIVGTLLLAGCTNGPTPWENEFEGYEGVRADVVSHRDLEVAENSRGDREAPPEPPEGAPAGNGNVLVKIRKSGEPTGVKSDEHCSLRDSKTKSKCDVEVQDAYQLPASSGNYGYPLGDDGAATLFLPPGTQYEIEVRGAPLDQSSECREYYFSSRDDSDIEPSRLKDSYDTITASEDHIVRVGYDVLCGSWNAA